MNSQDVRFGFKAGINISNSSEIETSTNSRTSFHVGGMMEALYENNFAIQPEIIYSQQGFDYILDGSERIFKFSYIHVPVMIKYYASNSIYVEAGPQIGYLNTARLETVIEGENKDIDIKEGMRSNDLSLNIGVGILFKNGINLNARYSYGLTNVVSGLPHDKFKNRIIQMSIGYLF
ncbi:PorT family protein [Subsaxibacter sp. CAU 1640]|nr:PorT family protein [Subsaxibacter sp. CAU 1640]